MPPLLLSDRLKRYYGPKPPVRQGFLRILELCENVAINRSSPGKNPGAAPLRRTFLGTEGPLAVAVVEATGQTGDECRADRREIQARLELLVDHVLVGFLHAETGQLREQLDRRAAVAGQLGLVLDGVERADVVIHQAAVDARCDPQLESRCEQRLLPQLLEEFDVDDLHVQDGLLRRFQLGQVGHVVPHDRLLACRGQHLIDDLVLVDVGQLPGGRGLQLIEIDTRRRRSGGRDGDDEHGRDGQDNAANDTLQLTSPSLGRWYCEGAVRSFGVKFQTYYIITLLL